MQAPQRATRKPDSRRCAHDRCTTQPRFNAPGLKTGLYCKAHVLNKEMVDVLSKRCAHDGCGIIDPAFNEPGLKTGLYCKAHVLNKEMVNVTSKRCAHDGCTTQPRFNAPGLKTGLYCKVHVLNKEMVDVVNKRCAHDGCGIVNPRFNAPGLKTGLYCKAHVLNKEMVNVTSKRCAHDGCGIIDPAFNAPGLKTGLYCKAHVLDKEMVDVKSKRCAHDGCGIVPKFNAPGLKTGLYCKAHVLNKEMVDVVSKRCAHDGCGIINPVFNAPDEKIGLYCRKHQQPGMISVQTTKCQEPKCREPATYGKDEFHRAQFCVVHKTATSVCIADAMRCSHDGCVEQYVFVVETEPSAGAGPSAGPVSRKVCLVHAPPGYEASLKRMCKYCDIRENVPFVCVDCQRRSKPQKEYAVVRHLHRTINVPLQYTSYDESPDRECTKKRPDIRFEMLTHDVIVEVDENQHRGYEESCECVRISEIVGAIGGKSVVFVRYNPDTVRFGGKVYAVTAAERIDLLVETVKKELRNAPSTFSVRLVQLWYNGPTAEPVRDLDITSLVTV